MRPPAPALGAWIGPDGVARFSVWAPAAREVSLALVDRDAVVVLDPAGGGWWQTSVDGLVPGDRYWYRLDGGPPRPDPASFAQPEGVHGPSALVAPDFAWTEPVPDPPDLADWVLYELHVGTFTTEGTFAAAAARLDDLADLGVRAVELMPVAEFPGDRNWGYDGVDPFAAHHAYGGLDGLRGFVDAAHRCGLAVVLDVVYNHVGPEGNHLGEFGPYFTDRYATPWGDALNFDGPGSDDVREFFVENARFWATHARVDGFRLDAVHAILDSTAYTFVEELTSALHRLGEERGRPVTVIAESSDNDCRLTVPVTEGGRGLDAQWSDGFHHALHVALTGERDGYYVDFAGLADLAAAFRRGFVYTGQHSAFRGRRHGRPEPPALERLVVFAQNHDQVGNRARGERLAALLDPEPWKLALACTLLAPSIPLLFMGGEEADERPFPYFTSHGDPALVEAVRRGRAEEFESFTEQETPFDPQDEATFRRAVLTPRPRTGRRATTRALVAALLEQRRTLPALDLRAPAAPSVDVVDDVLLVGRGAGADEVRLLASFAAEARAVDLDGEWTVVLDTADAAYGGPGRPELPDVPTSPASQVARSTTSVPLAPWSAVLLTRPEGMRR